MTWSSAFKTVQRGWASLRPRGGLQQQRAAQSTTAAVDSGLDRDPRCYLLSNQDLVYLKSPRSLMFKAETASELASELILALKTSRDDPVRCLSILDAISAILCLTLDACEATRSTHPKEEYRGHAATAFNFLQTHTDALNTDRSLLEPITKLCSDEIWPTLTPQQKHFVKVYKTELESLGVHLTPARSRLVAELNQRVDSRIEAAMMIEDKGQDPDVSVSELIAARHELAHVLGYDSYVSWSLKNCLAENPLDIWKVLLAFSNRLQEGARADVERLVAARAGLPFKARSVKAGEEHVIHDYEMRELISVIQRNEYPGAAQEMSEYLTIGNAWRGLEIICHELFGIRLIAADGMGISEQYEKNVVKFEVIDEATKELIGIVYADLIDRPTKAQGSGHFTVQVGSSFDETLCLDLDLLAPENGRIIPIVIFTCSVEGTMVEDDDDTSATNDAVPPPGSQYAFNEKKDKKVETTNWEKVLLSPDELVSMYHEFGHALHTVFGQTKYQSLSGTRSSMDYVEIFSQLFEMYARDHRSLKRFALHHKTREPLPKHVADRMNAMEGCCGSLMQLNEIVTACVDLCYHGPRPLTYFALDKTDPDVMVPIAVEDGAEHPLALRRSISDVISPIEVTELGNARAYTLQYLVNYPGNYYSYTYSRILATAIWQTHFDKDPFSKASGALLRKVMSRGASALPQDMLLDLLPDTSPEKILAAL